MQILLLLNQQKYVKGDYVVIITQLPLLVISSSSKLFGCIDLMCLIFPKMIGFELSSKIAGYFPSGAMSWEDIQL